MIVSVFDHKGGYRGAIADGDMLAFSFTDEPNGRDRVELSTTFELRGGDRLVWADPPGFGGDVASRLGRASRKHEHVCQEPRLSHDGDGIVHSCTALDSFCETAGDYIEDKRPGGASGSTWDDVLEAVLGPSRWSRGCNLGGNSSKTTFYHVNVQEAVTRLFERVGRQFRPYVETDAAGRVTARCVGAVLAKVPGNVTQLPVCRLEYGRNATGIRRTVTWDAITACYGYGRGVETEDGGYGRKLTFGDINNGVNYVADAAALQLYGRPDGDGGLAHVFGVYENPECDDAIELKSQTEIYLAEHSVPGVSYEADAELLFGDYVPWAGEEVQVVDTMLSPELRCVGSVSQVRTDMLTGRSTVTVGTARRTLTDIIYDIARGRQA